MRRLLTSVFALVAAAALPVAAQQLSTGDFKAATDSLKARMYRKTLVKTDLKLTKVILRQDDSLELYFNQNLADYPWRKEHVELLEKTFHTLSPAAYRSKGIAAVYAKKENLKTLIMPDLSNDGQPVSDQFRVSDPRYKGTPLVSRVGEDRYNRGLSGRYVALWQSHGRYWEEKTSRWEWQRAPTFTTVEDMYTQSYVLPFLIPMLENAGAIVMTPRERDTQRLEVVADNDPAFEGLRTGLIRRSGEYSETGSWEDAGEGFADAKKQYEGLDNPFMMGTARKSATIASSDPHEESVARWEATFPERGKYAVYVSYKTVKGSTRSALYSVEHLGGKTSFIVNQQMGGSTWIYLGTFEFDGTGAVSLTNRIPEDRTWHTGEVVTADGVRFGGGMGKYARGEEGEISGMPAFAEGALYSMLWGGMDEEVTAAHETEYTNEYASRGAWVSRMSGGSRINPKQAGKGIPFDVSLAFHTDAGVSAVKDSLIGTLSIYTLLADDKQTLPSGEDRQTCRQLADYVQTQIVSDLRKDFDKKWKRRFLWNRSYSESRTPSCPAMLLELLSHQNFSDMRYGLDPSFRFDVSRAVYKGILKYLSNRYGCSYVVQPLPVHSFAAELADSCSVKLSWLSTPDPKEATAKVSCYRLYTRIDDGAFDEGRPMPLISGKRGGCTVEITRGHVYSFKVEACNDGGRSFPSEILSVGIPEETPLDTVLIVNNFTRVAAPAWFDTPQYAGFIEDVDSGVPYMQEINYVGKMYDFRRDVPWTDDDCPGFGASYTDRAGEIIPGNTFDYPVVHGKALLALGYAFTSTSEDAFSTVPEVSEGIDIVDIIAGKQVTTPRGSRSFADRYQVFPKRLREKLTAYTAAGGNVFISGARIATDVWDHVYDSPTYKGEEDAVKAFVTETFGYKFLTDNATRTFAITPLIRGNIAYRASFEAASPKMYRIDRADGIVPAAESAFAFLRYADTGVQAAVAFEGENHKAVSIGFPIETIRSEESISTLLGTIMDYFKKTEDAMQE